VKERLYSHQRIILNSLEAMFIAVSGVTRLGNIGFLAFIFLILVVLTLVTYQQEPQVPVLTEKQKVELTEVNTYLVRQIEL